MLKYTITKKSISVLKNFLLANWKDVGKYIISKINKKYATNIEVSFWGDTTKPEDYDPKDYTLSGTEAEELPVIERQKLYMIDQGRAYRTRNACVPFNIYLQICNNLDIRPSYWDAKEWLNWAEVEKIWIESEGASIPVVVARICERWNILHPDRAVRYDRLYYTSDHIQTALNKWYQITGGRNTFSAYTVDKSDGKMDFSNYNGWFRAGGHCLNIMLGNIIKTRKQIEIQPDNTEKAVYASVKSNHLHCVNSYPSTQLDLNIYEHNRIDDHCKNGIWYSWFYLIHESNPSPVNPEKAEEQIEYKIRESAQIAKDRGIWNGQDGKDQVTREDAATMVNRAIDYAMDNKN